VKVQPARGTSLAVSVHLGTSLRYVDQVPICPKVVHLARTGPRPIHAVHTSIKLLGITQIHTIPTCLYVAVSRRKHVQIV
jgi:hypothetical protein